jgi:hypothetical protein
MFKNVFLLIVFTVAAVFMKNQLVYVLHGLLYLHNSLAKLLANIFAQDQAGIIFQSIISLVLIPIVGGGLIALGFYIAKKDHEPHMAKAMWVVWTVLLTTLLAQLV